MKYRFMAAGLITAIAVGSCAALALHMDRAIPQGSVDTFDISGHRDALTGVTVQGFSQVGNYACWIGEIDPVAGTSAIEFCHRDDERIVQATDAYREQWMAPREGGNLYLNTSNGGMSGTNLMGDIEMADDSHGYYMGYPTAVYTDAAAKVVPGTTKTIDINLSEYTDVVYPWVSFDWSIAPQTKEERYYCGDNMNTPDLPMRVFGEMFPLKVTADSHLLLSITKSDAGYVTDINIENNFIWYEAMSVAFGDRLIFTVVARPSEDGNEGSPVMDSPMLGEVWELDPMPFLEMDAERSHATGPQLELLLETTLSEESIRERVNSALHPLVALPADFELLQLTCSPDQRYLDLWGYLDGQPLLMVIDPKSGDTIQEVPLMPDSSNSEAHSLWATNYSNVQTAMIGTTLNIVASDASGMRYLWGAPALPRPETLIDSGEDHTAHWAEVPDVLFDEERLILLDRYCWLDDVLPSGKAKTNTNPGYTYPEDAGEILVLGPTDVLYHGAIAFRIPGMDTSGAYAYWHSPFRLEFTT